MQPRARRRARPHPLAPLTPIEYFRRERRWSYPHLTAQINAAGVDFPISVGTVTRFCQGVGRPLETTAHVVRKFLALHGLQAGPPLSARRSA